MRSAAAAAIAVVIALVAVASTASPARAAPSADELVAQVQAYYKKVDHLGGTFRQEVINPTYGTTKKSHGTVLLARPGKLRFDYARTVGTGVKRSLRSDGKHLWDIEHDNLEVISKDLGKDAVPAAVAVLTGTGDLAKDFTASLTTTSGFGDAGHLVVQLDARQPSAAWKQVFLVVAAADAHITETVVIDSSGNVNHLYLDKLDPKAKVTDSDFVADLDSKALKDYKRVDADRAAARTTDK